MSAAALPKAPHAHTNRASDSDSDLRVAEKARDLVYDKLSGLAHTHTPLDAETPRSAVEASELAHSHSFLVPDRRPKWNTTRLPAALRTARQEGLFQPPFNAS